VICGIGYRLLEKSCNCFLHIIDRHKINVFRRIGCEIDLHIHPVIRSDAQFGTTVTFNLAKKLKNAVKGQRFTDTAIGTAAGNDRRPVNRERDAAFTDEKFSLEFTFFVRVIEAVIHRIIFIRRTAKFTGNITGADIMKFFDIEQFRQRNHILGAAIIDPENFSGGIFSEIDISRTMENNINTLEFFIFGQLFRDDRCHVTFNNLNFFQNRISCLRVTVKSALIANDRINALRCTFSAATANQAYNIVILTFTQQGNHKCAADQSCNTSDQNFVHYQYLFLFLCGGYGNAELLFLEPVIRRPIHQVAQNFQTCNKCNLLTIHLN